MSKITWRAGTMLSPLPPALVSCGTMEKHNCMTAAWTGIICSDPVIIYVSIRPSRYSHKIISETKEFVINLPSQALVSAVDYCGVRSGKDYDKFKEMKLTAIPSSQISTPQIEECPISIECKVIDIKNYGTHDMFTAEVVAVNVDDKYIDEKGAFDIEKAGIIAFAHGKYYTLGRCLGYFGFSVNKTTLRLAQKMKNVEVEVKQASPKFESKKIENKNNFKFGAKSKFDKKAPNSKKNTFNKKTNKGKNFSKPKR